MGQILSLGTVFASAESFFPESLPIEHPHVRGPQALLKKLSPIKYLEKNLCEVFIFFFIW